MTLDEAIKILQERHRIGDPLKSPDYENALKLGIEAMKAYQKSQANGWYPPGFKLPGETERSEDEIDATKL